MKKYYYNGLYIFIGFIIGLILTGLFLSRFITSQRNQGRNEGALKGKREIFEFLNKNIKNDSLNAITTEIGVFYDFKTVRISIVEIDGVKTIRCIK